MWWHLKFVGGKDNHIEPSCYYSNLPICMVGTFYTQRALHNIYFVFLVPSGWWEQSERLKPTERMCYAINIVGHLELKGLPRFWVKHSILDPHSPIQTLHTYKRDVRERKGALLCPLIARSNLERTLLIEVTRQSTQVGDPSSRQARSHQSHPQL